MSINKTTNNQTSINIGKSTLDFKSCGLLEMKNFSQSELYNLSRSSSDAFDVDRSENDVIPNIQPNQRPTSSIATTTTTSRRIFAFSHRRRPPGHISGSDADEQVTENRLILNSLKKLTGEGDAHDSNVRGDAAVPVAAVDTYNPSEVQKRNRKRNRRRKRELNNNENEFEGLGVINMNGEVIDLKILARDADSAFESELNRLTEGMTTEDQFLGFLNSLDGRWGSTRKRRKYVDAAVFVEALPVNWKILLSLRPRARRPSLYCRRFVSPSDVHFNSCKDVAFYLKSLFASSNANPVELDLESGGRGRSSSNPDIRRDSGKSVIGLGSQLQKYHGNNNERLGKETDTLSRKRSVPHGLLIIREPMCPPPPPVIQNFGKQKTVVEIKDTMMRHNEVKSMRANGEGSSSEPGNNSEVNVNLKTRCFFCLVEFFHDPVDAETLASSCGFICRKCKEVFSGSMESSLSQMSKRANN